MSHATNIPPARPGGTLAAEHLPGTQTLLLRLSGRLDSANAGSLWRAAAVFLDKPPPARRLVVDASGVDYCDVSGVAFLTDLRRRWRGPGTSVEIQNLDERFRPLLALLSTDEPPAPPPPAPARLRPLVEGAGASARGLAADLRE
ncbi:MAG: STAS domain-containing protein, partial [Opitutaceae bacterium]|nr:STAS domain-containing protein [Opitutaceae bacterium]